jgi:hypothetical protein
MLPSKSTRCRYKPQMRLCVTCSRGPDHPTRCILGCRIAASHWSPGSRHLQPTAAGENRHRIIRYLPHLASIRIVWMEAYQKQPSALRKLRGAHVEWEQAPLTSRAHHQCLPGALLKHVAMQLPQGDYPPRTRKEQGSPAGSLQQLSWRLPGLGWRGGAAGRRPLPPGRRRWMPRCTAPAPQQTRCPGKTGPPSAAAAWCCRSTACWSLGRRVVRGGPRSGLLAMLQTTLCHMALVLLWVKGGRRFPMLQATIYTHLHVAWLNSRM